MPRASRLDLPGVLQHVTVRGIDRRDVFLGDEDREDFVGRLSSLLLQTGTECLAWALLPNHFHLLLRPRDTPLATVMRRLLTGYAVSFNLRHDRAGRLFQNRYRSILCDEETYLLELVRYIHLNPLRAKLVSSLGELDTFRWSGHAVLMGLRSLDGQAVREVLARFGRIAREARRGYWHYVAAGASAGHREEFGGGGLRRSLLRGGTEPKSSAHDDRVLGPGEFVERVRRQAQTGAPETRRLSLDDLRARVAAVFHLDGSRIATRSTLETVREARSVFCYLAVRRLGYRGTEAGPVLGLNRSGTSKAVERGRQLVAADPALGERILNGSIPVPPPLSAPETELHPA